MLFSLNSYSQYSWTQKSNFTGAARDYAAGFTIGHYGFVGAGNNGASIFYNDFYEWDQNTNTWSSIAPYPGAGYHYSPIGFSIEGVGYIGLGWTGSNAANDLWAYDFVNNSWKQMASLPGTGRYDASVFVVGHKAYIVGGSIGGPPYLQDVWMYDAHTNTWTQMNNSPAGRTDDGVAFTIGNHGYVGGGKDELGPYAYNAFWEYDTTSDSWSSIAPFPILYSPTGNSRAFVIGDTAFVCTGTTNNSDPATFPTGYCYDTVSKAWSPFTNMGANGIERGYTVAFTIGNFGYICTGMDSVGNILNDLWQWGPVITGANQLNTGVRVAIYPNPCKGLLNFAYSGNIQCGEIQITDLTGRIIDFRQINSSNGRMIIDENSLDNGMYFYKLLDSGKLLSSGKFIISK